MEKRYSNCGLTAEQLADLSVELVTIFVHRVDLAGTIREFLEKHPELTDEQKEVLELREYSPEELDKMCEDVLTGLDLKSLFINSYQTAIVQEAFEKLEDK